jgi:ribonuclease I
MRRWLIAAALSGISAAPSAQANSIDHYTLIMSWTPGLCWEQPQRAECADLSLRRYDGRNLAFLALRPDPPEDNMRDQYCFAGMGDPDLDQSRRWCDMDEVRVRSKDLKAALDEVMPVTRSCQERGIWARYGTCSLFSPDEYFSRGVKLAKRMAGTLINVRLGGAAGQTIKKDDLNAYFEMQFGEGSAKSLLLVCKSEAGKAHLLEVQVSVTSHALTTGLDARELWKPQKPQLGKCPAEIFIDAPKDMILDQPAGNAAVEAPGEPAAPGKPILPNTSPVVPSPNVIGPTIGGPNSSDVEIGGPEINGPVVPKTPVPAPSP